MKYRPRFINLALVLAMLFGAMGFFPHPVNAATGLIQPGDIAVILMNTDDPDAIAFVALVDLQEGESIIFTDSGWYASGGFRYTEGAVRYTVPTGGLPSGTIVYRDTPFNTNNWDVPSGLGFSNDFSLSASGDQVIAFQGDTTSYSLIYALNGEGAAVWQTDATSSNSSALPTGLVNGETAVAVNELDNIKLNCSENHTGTKQELLEYISDNNNWVGDNTNFQSLDPNCSFTVTEDISEPLINEFSISTTGMNVEYVEIYGDPETDYSAYTVLEIEGDSDSSIGTIDEVIAIDTTDTNGLYLADLAANTLENGTVSLLLVKDFSGALDDDIDSNDDGTIDVEPWSAIIDTVAVNDGDMGDITYGTTELYEFYDGLSFAPGGASRIPDGYDTDAATDWVRNDFDLGGIEGYSGSLIEGEAFNTPGAPNMVYMPPPEACGDAYIPIYEIQGSGLSTPLSGIDLATEGIVVGDFQTEGYVSGTKNGFYIQALSPDGNPATSDGIFVYYYGLDVQVGDHVRVRGTATEYSEMTQIGSVSQVWTCKSGVTLPEPTVFALPVEDELDFERHEGMYVTIPQYLVIAEYFNFDRYGEIMLATERFMTFTAANEPDVAGFTASEEEYFLSTITLDDGRTNQNPDPAIHPNGEVFTMDNLFRGGDLVANVTGVIDYYYDLYRIQPTQGADYTPVNDRPVTLDLEEGSLKVASFNVLNYFITIDDGPDICGPSGDMECRGADSAAEFGRQKAKIIAAMTEINADVFGLMEIENDSPSGAGDAVADLVAGLNDVLGFGTYDYIDTGAIGEDAIKVALLYKPASVTPIGHYEILDSTVDSRFIDTKNRPTLAQVFEDKLTGETFTVAVNHLKSKGSPCDDLGDPDLGDGSGNCNLTRLTAAEAMVDWLSDDSIFSEVDNVLIVGDLNSYDKEAPIDAIKLGADDTPYTGDDYFDMIYEILGEYAYGYVFDGTVGYLDYAMASTSIRDNILDVAIWHINADEPDLIDYDMSFKKPNQDALYAPDKYRSSDHDPVIISLNLNEAPNAVDDYYQTNQDTPLSVTADDGVLDNDSDPNENDALSVTLNTGPCNGDVSLNEDGSFTYTPDEGFFGVDSFTYYLRAIPQGLRTSQFVDTATVYIEVKPAVKIFLPFTVNN